MPGGRVKSSGVVWGSTHVGSRGTPDFMAPECFRADSYSVKVRERGRERERERERDGVCV